MISDGCRVKSDVFNKKVPVVRDVSERGFDNGSGDIRNARNWVR